MNLSSFNFPSNIEYCKEIVDSATNLLLYSHIPISIIVLSISLYIYIHNKTIFARILLLIGVIFSLWTLLNMGIWFYYDNASILMALWSPIELLSISLFILNFLFIYLFVKKINTPPLWLYLVSFFILLPIILSLPSKFNLSGYDLGECIAIEYLPRLTLIHWTKIFISISTTILIIYSYIKNINNKIFRKQILLLGLGTIIFFITFLLAGYISEVTGNYSFEFYGLSGMIFFVSILTNLIIRFKLFNIKIITSQILVLSLVSLIGSLLFIVTSTQAKIIVLSTLFLIIILGYNLINSIKKEIKLREQLEGLTSDLYEANVKLQSLDKLKTEFVSLASHQLRSPLTAMKGYTSMLLEGDYGEINPQAKEILERVSDSSRNLTLVVEDLLNVAKIEQGGMQYTMDKVDFADLTRSTAQDLAITAEKKGLKLICDIPKDKQYFVNGDKEKLRQILINLIDNSMKYTKEGQIEVNINSNNKKIILSIKDTGVGISKEAMETLFKKFSRGDGAKMNSTGTGLGLYLVKEIIEAHHGRVWIESEGVGHGSTFFVEIDEVE